MIAVATFAGGLFALLVAGHFVISRASALGARFGLSPMVIGLTIVAAGTSAPELAVVGQAIAADDTELAVGSIIGSNIANVLLVLGLAATLGTVCVTSRVVRIDIPVMIAASGALLVFALDGRLGRADGGVLFSALAIFVTWTLRAATGERLPGSIRNRPQPDGPSAAMEHNRRVALPRPPTAATVALLAIGIGGLALAARFVVVGAEDIAKALGMPELIIGLTVVALGTSAPEIATTLIAAPPAGRTAPSEAAHLRSRQRPTLNRNHS